MRHDIIICNILQVEHVIVEKIICIKVYILKSGSFSKQVTSHFYTRKI